MRIFPQKRKLNSIFYLKATKTGRYEKDSRVSDFFFRVSQNPRKMYKVYILEIIRAKFHQNRFSRLGCSADTDRQTDTRTHIHTHTHIHTPSVRSQHIQSNWLNIKMSAENGLPLKKKKQRQKNFSSKEINILLEEVSLNYTLLKAAIILCKIIN